MPTDPTVAATAAGTSSASPPSAATSALAASSHARRRCPRSSRAARCRAGESRSRRSRAAPMRSRSRSSPQRRRRSGARSRSSAPIRSSAQRLAEEIARVRAGAPASRSSPTGKRCRTTSSRRTRTSSPSASPRCTALSRSDCDVILLAAIDRDAPARAASYLAALTFFLKQGDRFDVERVSRAGRTRRLHARHAGRLARRVQRARRTRRPLPDGLARCRTGSTCSATRSRRSTRSTSTRSARSTRCRDVRLLPAREFPLDEAGRTRFRSRFREVFEGDPSKSPLYKDVSNGIVPGGIEYYLPLFFDATATFADYLPRACRRRACTATSARRSTASGRTPSRATGCCAATRRGRCFRRPSCSCRRTSSARALKTFGRVEFPIADANAALPPDAPTRRLPPVQVDRRADDPLAALKRALAHDRRARAVRGRKRRTARDDAAVLQRVRLAACAGRRLRGVPGRRREMRARAGAAPRRASCGRTPGSRSSPKPSCTRTSCVADGATPAGARTSTRWCATSPRCASAIRSSTSSTASAATSGLTTLDLGDGAERVPAARLRERREALRSGRRHLHLISRYSGAPPEAAPLHELGSGQWEKAKRKAAQQAHDTAAELLNLYAQRAARAGARVRVQAARLRGVCRRLRASRKRPTSRRRSRR